jgi:hypothetical protein
MFGMKSELLAKVSQYFLPWFAVLRHMSFFHVLTSGGSYDWWSFNIN